MTFRALLRSNVSGHLEQFQSLERVDDFSRQIDRTIGPTELLHLFEGFGSLDQLTFLRSDVAFQE